jgi:Amt family ammonium transporter
MVATGAGLLWLGWNGFNGGDPYYAGASASAAVLNTNLACAVAFLGWVAWDYITGRKPTLIGSVNGMITGLVAITPAAGYVDGWGALAIGLIGTTIVYFALNYLSRIRPFRKVDDTLGVIYTHGFAGLAGGLMVGIFANPKMVIYPGCGTAITKGSADCVGATGTTADITPFAGLIHGSATLLKEQAYAGAWVICFCAIGTFILLKLIGLVLPLRMTEDDMEEGDLAVHGHEVYPSDVPSLSYPGGVPAARAMAAPSAPSSDPEAAPG